MNKIYCTIPWTEVHINADGTYHTCGAQPNTVTGTDFGDRHNVFSMTVAEWMSSAYQTQVRKDKLGGVGSDLCNMCYREEAVNKSSKRQRELHKYPVVPLEYQREDIVSAPISYHVSFGNECNLSCVMCSPWFSSKIAAEEKRRGAWSLPAKLNWTDNESAWNMVVESICNTVNLQAVHIIGGEPLINDRFEKLVDKLILSGRTNIYLGFTTNGTIFNQALLEKLNVFKHVDIGVSIETVGALNDYIREGSNTFRVLENIKLYLKHRKQGHVYVTLRIVPSALSVHTVDELFLWCIDHQLDVMSNLLVRPNFMAINNLPNDVKEKLLQKFDSWQYSTVDIAGTNPRDPTYFREHIDNELRAIIKMLNRPGDPVLTQQLYDFLTTKGWFKNKEIQKLFETSQL